MNRTCIVLAHLKSFHDIVIFLWCYLDTWELLLLSVAALLLSEMGAIEHCMGGILPIAF